MADEAELATLRERVTNLERTVLLLAVYARDGEGYETLKRALASIRAGLHDSEQH